jgi:hypothetical protein
MRSLLLALLLAAAANAALAAPAVFWTGDPVRPGETALLVGEGFPAEPTVELSRLPDGPAGATAKAIPPAKGRRAAALQPGAQALKIVLPADLAPGVFRYRVSGAGAAVTGLLNRPALWWAQGDGGTFASPGGRIRAFGKNLALAGAPKSLRPLLRLKGARTVLLPAVADAYSARAAVPANLPPGEYALSLHNGCGGPAAWSDPVRVTIARPKPWPARVYNVKEFGADGTGAQDSTAAVQAALAKAGAEGGGVVYFPRGRYQVSEMLSVPRFTLLHGEGRELVSLFWPDLPNPPQALVRGTNSFGIENLTLFAGNHVHVIASDQGTPDAGDVLVRRVRVRADAYMGHL